MNQAEKAPLAAVQKLGQRLRGNLQDYDSLLAQAGARDIVILGETSLGTEEFCQTRVDITRRLIEEKGFEAVAVDADALDAQALNRLVDGVGADAPGRTVHGSGNAPFWSWPNRALLPFLSWLRSHNRAYAKAVGFYGLDSQDFYGAASEALAFLQATYPQAAPQAGRCLDRLSHLGRHRWAASGRSGPLPDAYRQALVSHLLQSRTRRYHLLRSIRETALGAGFQAQRSGQTADTAGDYYRLLCNPDDAFWDLREVQMADGLFALQQHLREQGGRGKVVVWAHSLSGGDASGIHSGRHGQPCSLGQLTRARVGPDACLLVGLTTHGGSVTVAADWGGRPQQRPLPPAAEGSLESLLYRSGLERAYLPLNRAEAGPLRQVMLQRAIGLAYPSEQVGHYFHGAPARQFDALFHFDRTSALGLTPRIANTG